ncbi:hypothetical protein BKA67DRAFT_319263 [Truncatella angustata]|uniref:Uncharacterized protein n=1 Tax=Truncatella angustata TaxID=152316 RepID=A0A9P8ZWX6_9PEZI|nr:uncharacterized protein BKA67DRAFT_319263 [Truncatella angustata]KAH6653387.1 hypothetical protein BKA67DRAFT_319263 [Truncatella angustata]
MDQFLTPQELNPRRRPATPSVASSQLTANNTLSPLSQLVPVEEPADTPTQTLTTPASQNDAYPDYQLWCMEWWCRFPNCELDFNIKNMRVWWWAHGYRLINKQSRLPKHIWVCSICVAKSKPPPTDTYTFVSSTSKSIVNHLRRVH